MNLLRLPLREINTKDTAIQNVLNAVSSLGLHLLGSRRPSISHCGNHVVCSSCSDTFC
ncbi:hypothetical protein J6590_046934 [Homalodisca vitripennis]|nr:hypothetical protein J6590_046934 [Homalodisca vitripennis]